MRKKRDESTKKAEKGQNSISILPVLLGTGISLGLVLLVVLLMATLISGGVVPADTPSLLLSACAGLCAFVGARVSIRKGSVAPMVGGPVMGVILCMVMILISVGCLGQLVFHRQFAGTLLMLLAGSCLAGLFGKPKRKPKQRKKKK